MTNLLVIGGITPQMKIELEKRFTLQFINDLDMPLKWLKENGMKFSYILTNGHDGVNPDHLNAMPNLKLISNYGVGYEAIDTDLTCKRGILVTHTPDVLNAEVATTAIMLMLACYRRFEYNGAYARSGKWESKGNVQLSHSADNRTVGIVGLGRIGLAIAKKLEAFNARILYHTRTPKDVPYEYFASLTEMAVNAEALICITPGGKSTQHLINREVIEALGPEGVLINVARGTVVDEPALIEALQSGRLGWAGLDVFEHEPAIPESLRNLPNTVLTPHIGSATVETRNAMGKLAIDNLLQYLDDQTVITPVPECIDLCITKNHSILAS